MKLVLRDNTICKNRKITKNDIIAAGIRNCRSPSCHEHIIKNIKSVSESTATDWIHGIASASYDNKTFFAKSALNTLHKLLPGRSIFDRTFLNENKKKLSLTTDVSLAFGNLIRRLDDGFKNEVVNEGMDWEVFMRTRLDEICDGRGKVQKMEAFQEGKVLMKTIGNSGFTGLQDVVLKCMNTVKTSQHDTYDLRVYSVQAFRNMKCAEISINTWNALWTVLQDEDEDSEIRIEAYRQYMNCPSMSRIAKIVELLEADSGIYSLQVGSYIMSDLKNVAENKRTAHFSPFLQKIIASNNPKLQNFIQANLIAGYSDLKTFSIPVVNLKVSTEFIFSETSSYLRSMRISIRDSNELTPHSKKSEIFHFYARCRDLRELLAAFINDNNFYEKLPDTIKGFLKRLLDQNTYHPDLDIEMAEKGTAASISAELSMKWFDKEITFFQKPVNDIVDSLKTLIKDHRSFSSATLTTSVFYKWLLDLSKGFSYHRSLEFYPRMNIHQVPSFSGLFMEQDRQGIANVDFEALAHWSFLGNNRINMNPAVDLLLSDSFLVDGRQLVVYKQQLTTSTKLDMLLKNGASGFKVSFNLPDEPHMFVKKKLL
jgi:hypothetical protein